MAAEGVGRRAQQRGSAKATTRPCKGHGPSFQAYTYFCTCCAAGTKEETQEEVARLKERLANVTSGDAAAAATKADPSDKSGRLLSLLLRWREERKATLQKEIDRQEARLADMAAAAAGSLRVVTAEEKLVEWLKDNGAQVGKRDKDGSAEFGVPLDL